MGHGSPGRLVRRALLVVGVTLLTSEIVLQLAAVLVPVLDRRGVEAIAPDAVRILVVGDSHAAGGGAPPEESLPAHLQRDLTKRHPERVFHVVNAGLSGANSAWVANRLERNLDRHRPELLIVWVGLNDTWNLTETEVWGHGGWRSTLRRWLLNFRTYRLATVLWHTGRWEDDSGASLQRQAGMRTGSVPPEEVHRGLSFDLQRMARMAFARRIAVIFMLYPLPYPVNRTITSMAWQLGIPTIRTALDFARAREDGHDRSEILDFAAGPHPTGLLYGYIAESTLPTVEKLLRGQGVALAPPAVTAPSGPPHGFP